MENVIHANFDRTRRVTSASRCDKNASRIEQTIQRAVELSKLHRGDTFTADEVKVHVLDERRSFKGRELLLASKGEKAWVPDSALFAALPEHFA